MQNSTLIKKIQLHQLTQFHHLIAVIKFLQHLPNIMKCYVCHQTMLTKAHLHTITL